MINRYQDFLFESMLESLILESKVIISKKLENLLKSIEPDNVRDSLLRIVNSGQDLNLIQNYFDISTTNKDELEFIQDRKATQILNSDITKWKVRPGVKVLTLRKRDGEYVNGLTFQRLGFEPTSETTLTPPVGTIGEIINQVGSKKTDDKFFVLFKWGEDSYAVLSKEHIEPHDDRLDKIWLMKTNPMKIGRVLNSLFRVANIQVSPSELENFVTKYKAAWDFMKDAFNKFDIVKGQDISHWYLEDNYEKKVGTMGQSCMRYSDATNFLDIYTENEDVCSLVILYSDNGKLVNGKWVSDKIKGRALLWETNHGKLLDRIYTNNEEDVELFKKFADHKDWWHKLDQDFEQDFIAVKNGSRMNRHETWYVDLDNYDFDYYPYVDTLCYLNKNDGCLSNGLDYGEDIIQLRSTLGRYYQVSTREEEDD